MKKIFIYLFFVVSTLGVAQTPGLIYQRVQDPTGVGQKVLDPNNDGFISVTSTGFSGTDFGTNSELRMIPLPIIQGELSGDLTTGSSGGHTDIVSALVGGVASRESCYILYKTVDGIPYIVIRMRIGKASTSPKGYSFLLNTDGVFSTGSTGTNPGYDKEIVLQTGSAAVAAVYSHSGATTTLLNSYPAAECSQRSIALSTINGDADYFYDFFIPFSALGITNDPVGITAVTVTSAGSGITGTISDFNGVNDSLYGGDRNLIMSALISSFPAIPITDLTENFDYETLYKPKTLAPVVNEGLVPASTSISGTSIEANGTVITVYKNGISIGTTTVNNNTWTLTGVTGLAGGNLITATALATGKSASDVSNTIVVSSSAQECFIASPTNIVRAGNNQATNAITGSWSGAFASTGSNVKIRLYTQDTVDPNVFNEFTTIPVTSNQFVTSGGTFSIIVNLANNVFSTLNFIAKAENVSNSCLSGYSNVTIRTNGNATANGYITPKPTIQNTIVYQSSSSQQITVLNNGADAGTTDVNGVTIPASPVPSILNLYINGALFAQSGSTIAANGSHIFSVPSLSETDVLSARAQGIDPAQAYWLSYVSNLVTVQLNTPSPTLAPVITGTYTAGTGKTITGTSSEPAGTEIKVYKAGPILLGTTTVTAFGTWQITGITLATSDVLTATAKATDKSLSGNSNSVTVQASAPTPPTISNEYTEGQTTITGTAGNTLVEVLVDGDKITQATPTSGNWSATVSNTDLYRGAQITARNVVNGINSANSAAKIVTGVVRFCITLADGSPIPATIQSGETLSIKITAVSNDACPGTTFTGFTGTANLSSNVVITPQITGSFVNGVWTGTITLGGTGTANIFVSNTSNPTTTGSASTTINTDALWVGTNSTDFGTASNWSGNYVPGSGAKVTFASGVLNNLHLDTSRLIGDLDFNNGGHSYKVVLGNNTLEIRGNISNSSANKSITSSDSSKLTLSGYGASSPVFFTTGSTIDELTLNKTSSGAITVSSPIKVISILRVVNGTLTSNGNITLASTATKTAVVPTVGGNIVGNVTVEKYIPARRAFRFLTSTVNTSTSINANWQEGATNPNTTGGNVNPNSGYGTHITGNGESGFDATNTTNYSMFTYNNLTPAWANITNTDSDNLVAGRPYRILIRGDRSINLNVNNPPATPTTLRATGTLVVGNHTILAATLNQTNNAYSFIGNPYHARVNMREVLKSSGFQRKVWYWNSNYGATGRGAYVAVDFSIGTTKLDDLISVTNDAPNSSIVEPFAAFFVRKSGETVSDIVFRESDKMSETSNSVLFRNANNPTNNDIQRIALSLHETGNVLASDNTLDGTLIVFNEAFDSNLTEDDMPKFSNLDEDLAVQYDNSRVSIDKRNVAVSSDVIQLGITKYRYTNYRLGINLTNYDGLAPYLVDQFLNTTTPLVPGTNYSYLFSVQSSVVASTSANRFKIVFNTTTLGAPIFENAIVLYPNPGNSTTGFSLQGVVAADITLHNYLGQQLPIETSEGLNAIQVKPSTTLNQGVYLITVKHDGKISQFKWIVN